MGQRLYGVVCALLALYGAAAITGLLATAEIKDNGEQVIAAGRDRTTATRVEGLLHDSHSDMEMLVVDMERHDGVRARARKFEITDQVTEITSLLGSLEKTDDALQNSATHDLEAAVRSWKGEFDTLSERAAAEDLTGARLQIVGLETSADRASEAAKALVSACENRCTRLGASSAATFARTRTLQCALLGLAVLIGAVAILVVHGTQQTLASVATELQQSASEVAAASGHVASTAQSLSRGAISQAASIEETSASMEEMASMTRQNADNSAEAARLMREADASVERSNAVLREMVTSMRRIRESSDKVSRIIKTIDEIAFQTNILALNAAVEAARAGEAGMGFAVVADEVRSLAQRSAQAARDTAVLIEESIQNAQQGGERVVHVEQAIGAITSSVLRVKALVDQVSEASREQAQGLDQVSGAISRMESVTQTTAASAEESAAASEELAAQAESVLHSVRSLEHLIVGRSSDPIEPASPEAHSSPSPQPLRPPRHPVVVHLPSPKQTDSPSNGADLIPFDDDESFVPFEDARTAGRPGAHRAA